METLRTWSSCVCFAAIGCAAVEWIVPKEKTGKLFRLLIVTFFICSMAMPLFKISSHLSLETDFLPDAVVSEQLQEKVTQQLKQQVVQTVESITSECLSYREIKAREICVDVDISAEGSIYIQQVVIRVDKQKAAAALAVRDVLQTQLGTTVVIETER